MGKKNNTLDAVGWTFYAIVLLVLVVPCIYVAWQVLVGEWASRVYPVGIGIVLAAVGAGFISWTVNAVLHNRRKKEKLAERKQAKKKK